MKSSKARLLGMLSVISCGLSVIFPLLLYASSSVFSFIQSRAKTIEDACGLIFISFLLGGIIFGISGWKDRLAKIGLAIAGVLFAGTFIYNFLPQTMTASSRPIPTDRVSLPLSQNTETQVSTAPTPSPSLPATASTATAPPPASDAAALELQPIPIAEFFGASHEVIATRFGPPISSSQTDESDTRYYNPASFAPHFPEISFKHLSVRFDNGKAVAAHLQLELPMPTIPGPGSLAEDEAAALALHTTFFQALFQDSLPPYRLLAHTHPGMSLQVAEYCSVPGVSTALVDGQLYDLNFYSEPAC